MKIKAVILSILIVFGISLSLYVYWGIVEREFLSATLFFIAFLLTAMFAAKIMAEFRQLNKYVAARNKIQNILLPITQSRKHASILAENLVLRETKPEDWPEIPREKNKEIILILESASINPKLKNKKTP